jgi:hypothetical protein
LISVSSASLAVSEQLFADSAETMRLEIKRITGVDVRESTAEVETKSGTVVLAVGAWPMRVWPPLR